MVCNLGYLEHVTRFLCFMFYVIVVTAVEGDEVAYIPNVTNVPCRCPGKKIMHFTAVLKRWHYINQSTVTYQSACIFKYFIVLSKLNSITLRNILNCVWLICSCCLFWVWYVSMLPWLCGYFYISFVQVVVSVVCISLTLLMVLLSLSSDTSALGKLSCFCIKERNSNTWVGFWSNLKIQTTWFLELTALCWLVAQKPKPETC